MSCSYFWMMVNRAAINKKYRCPSIITISLLLDTHTAVHVINGSYFFKFWRLWWLVLSVWQNLESSGRNLLAIPVEELPRSPDLRWEDSSWLWIDWTKVEKGSCVLEALITVSCLWIQCGYLPQAPDALTSLPWSLWPINQNCFSPLCCFYLGMNTIAEEAKSRILHTGFRNS